MREKIVICGGHFMPAFALLEKLQSINRYEIHYVGRKTALEGDKAESLEYNTLEKLAIPFHSLSFARLQRNISRHTFISLLRFPLSLVQSILLLESIKPVLVISFGGYVALPVCLAASILGIPVITHEQTHSMGLSNQIIAKFAKITCLTWKNTKFVPEGTFTKVIGNSIRTIDYKKKDERIIMFGDTKLSLLYITGGSLGSHSINMIIKSVLPQIVSKFRIIHQCGNANNSSDLHELKSDSTKLSSYAQCNYKPVSFLTSDEVNTVLRNSYIVIARAGANTVFEIAHHRVPAIFIPLPWAANNEQYNNAYDLVNLGCAMILDQKTLSPQLLMESITFMMNNYQKFQEKTKKTKGIYLSNGTEKLLQYIIKYKKKRNTE